MSPNLLPKPDAVPLREALRGLRFLLRRGGEALADTVTVEALPGPASGLATTVLRDVGGFVRSMDSVAEAVAKSVMGTPASPAIRFETLVGQPDSDVAFAGAIYAALSAVLNRLGVSSVFVSELAARATFANWRKQAIDGQLDQVAANLTLGLLDARVIRGTASDPDRGRPAESLEPAAVFAVLLWLQSSRSDDENEAALEAATDIAMAKAGEILAAVQTRDPQRIAAMYRKYVDHV